MSLYYSISVAMISAIVSSQSVCIWGKPVNNSLINGLYSPRGKIHNGKPILQSNTSGCNTEYLYWDTLPTNNGDSGWLIFSLPTSPLTNILPHAYCSNSAYYQNCSTWIVYNGSNYIPAPNVTIHMDSCPEWNCDTVSVPSLTNGCNVLFDESLGNNTWKDNAETRWWFFNYKYFTWQCVDKHPKDYGYCSNINAWIDLENGESISMDTINCIDNINRDKQNDVLMIEIILLIIVLGVTYVLLIGFGFRYFFKIRSRAKRDQESTVSDVVIYNKRQSDIRKDSKQVAIGSHSSIKILPTNNQSDIVDTEIVFQNANHINKTDTLIVRVWLSEVGFPEYYDAFVSNGYDAMDVIMAIENKNDLNEIGIVLKGHQTKLLFEIRKLQKTQTKEEDIKPQKIITVEEISEESKNNDAQSDCSDTDSNKYENEYPIGQTMSDNYYNNQTVTVSKTYPITVEEEKNNDAQSDCSDTDSNKYENDTNTYPITVTVSGGYHKTSYDEKNNYFVNETENAYPMNKHTYGDNNNNNNVTKNGMAYPIDTDKG
eukprot:122546_1